MTTTDKQRIVFEQGAALTGDSGERGNATTLDGGVESVKPVNDGERAHQDVFRRPEENIRRRTERLRDAGEETKYLMDQVRWAITPGRDTGESIGPLEPLAEIVWNPLSGIFTFSEAVVLQPLNTPGTDQQETVSYSFTDTIPNTANIDFTPTGGGDGDAKRAYNGANLLEIVWVAELPGNMGSAIVPGKVDLALSGDPIRRLTITIASDNSAQMSDLASALSIFGVSTLSNAGYTYVIGGTTATYLEFADITTPDFVFTGNFDREVHYIPPTTWSDFFAVPNALSDGDSLCIEWTYYVEPDPGIAGRRQRIPSNITATYPQHTTVLPGQLFITSDNPERIPFAIPLCKRVGDHLFWLDGMVCTASGNIIYPGEHGVTVDRIVDGLELNVTSGWFTTDPPSWAATATLNSAINGILDDLSRATTGGGAVEIGKSAYPNPGGTGWSASPVWVSGAQSVGWWLETVLVEANKCARVAQGEYITGSRWNRNSIWMEATPNDDSTPGTETFYRETNYHLKDPTFINHVRYSSGNIETHLTRIQKYSRGGIEYYRNGPVSGLYTYNPNSGNLTANQLVVGSGVAWVGGHQVFCDGFTIGDVWNGSAGEGGLTDATKTTIGGQSALEVCYCVYVWMRIDGTVWLDIHGVELDGGTHWREGASGYYYPPTASGLPHTNYNLEDYALVDVCWLSQGNVATGDSAVRLAGFIPMGGGFRAFQQAKFWESSTFTQIYHRIGQILHTYPNEIILSTNYADSGAYERRCPGLPVVSNLGRFAIQGQGNTGSMTIQDTTISMGNHLDDFPHVNPAFLAQFTGTRPYTSAWGPSIIFRENEPAPSGGFIFKMDTGDCMYVRKYDDYRTSVGITIDDNAVGTRPTFTLDVIAIGFWWDKFSGPMVSHFERDAPS